MKAIIPNDLHKVITSSKYDPPFEVIDMTANGFWDIKEAADRYFNTKKLEYKWIVKIQTVLLTKESFTDLEPWKEVNILKKGKTIEDLKSATITLLPPENKISENKKRSLSSMTPYLGNPVHKKFYKELLNINDD
nr:unnamed protein product [Callosobruchus analis]